MEKVRPGPRYPFTIDGSLFAARHCPISGKCPEMIEPYQIQVGNAVPASALPLVFPGSKLHAKLGDGPNDVVVDWAAGAVKE